MRNASVAGAPIGSAAVVSKRDGRGHIVVLGGNKWRHLRSRKLLACGFRKFVAAWLSQTKAARRHAAGKCDEPFSGRPAWEAKRPCYEIRRKRGQGRGIAGSADACRRMLTWWGDNRRAHLNDQNGN